MWCSILSSLAQEKSKHSQTVFSLQLSYHGITSKSLWWGCRWSRRTSQPMSMRRRLLAPPCVGLPICVTLRAPWVPSSIWASPSSLNSCTKQDTQGHKYVIFILNTVKTAIPTVILSQNIDCLVYTCSSYESRSEFTSSSPGDRCQLWARWDCPWQLCVWFPSHTSLCCRCDWSLWPKPHTGCTAAYATWSSPQHEPLSMNVVVWS